LRIVNGGLLTLLKLERVLHHFPQWGMLMTKPLTKPRAGKPRGERQSKIAANKPATRKLGRPKRVDPNAELEAPAPADAEAVGAAPMPLTDVEQGEARLADSIETVSELEPEVDVPDAVELPPNDPVERQ
jgi:hypothetical protein